MDVNAVVSKVMNDFIIGMNLYEASWDDPGEVITYTLGSIRIDVVDVDYCHIIFELVHSNPIYSTIYTYTDYLNETFYRLEQEARDKSKSFIHKD